jgi:hypothetical protein
MDLSPWPSPAVRPSALRPGDILLYEGRGVFSAAIRLKTWSHISHVEIADYCGTAVASRDGLGVGRYPLRYEGLVCVMRVPADFNLEKARAWFATVDGQRYDWLGLAAFLGTGLQGWSNNRQFCSEFATRYLRAGGINLFHGWDADGIAPGEFRKQTIPEVVWEAPRQRWPDLELWGL